MRNCSTLYVIVPLLMSHTCFFWSKIWKYFGFWDLQSWQSHCFAQASQFGPSASESRPCSKVYRQCSIVHILYMHEQANITIIIDSTTNMYFKIFWYRKCPQAIDQCMKFYNSNRKCHVSCVTFMAIPWWRGPVVKERGNFMNYVVRQRMEH